MYMLCRSFDPLSREATLLISGIEIVIFVCKFINTINMLRKFIRRTNFRASTVDYAVDNSFLINSFAGKFGNWYCPSQLAYILDVVPFSKTYHSDHLPPKSLVHYFLFLIIFV
jgi:hypothetical protein